MWRGVARLQPQRGPGWESLPLASDRFIPLQVRVSVNGAVALEEPVGQLRALWEETSFRLDRLQAEPSCVAEEERGLRERTGPRYCLPPGFPEASVPREPGEEVCAEPWLPGPLGLEARPALQKVLGLGQVAQLVRASSRHTRVSGLIPGQSTYQ